MRVLNFIFGLLAIFAGVVCLSNPVQGFLVVIWLSAIFLLIFGIIMIVGFFKTKKLRDQGILASGGGILSLILGIATIILSILALTNQGASEFFAIAILVLFTIWLFMTAFSTIFMGNVIRKEGGTGTGLFLIIFGIIIIILGICAITSPLTGVFAIGTILAIELIFAGINSIIQAFGSSE